MLKSFEFLKDLMEKEPGNYFFEHKSYIRRAPDLYFIEHLNGYFMCFHKELAGTNNGLHSSDNHCLNLATDTTYARKFYKSSKLVKVTFEKDIRTYSLEEQKQWLAFYRHSNDNITCFHMHREYINDIFDFKKIDTYSEYTDFNRQRIEAKPGISDEELYMRLDDNHLSSMIFAKKEYIYMPEDPELDFLPPKIAQPAIVGQQYVIIEDYDENLSQLIYANMKKQWLGIPFGLGMRVNTNFKRRILKDILYNKDNGEKCYIFSDNDSEQDIFNNDDIFTRCVTPQQLHEYISLIEVNKSYESKKIPEKLKVIVPDETPQILKDLHAKAIDLLNNAISFTIDKISVENAKKIEYIKALKLYELRKTDFNAKAFHDIKPKVDPENRYSGEYFSFNLDELLGTNLLSVDKYTFYKVYLNEFDEMRMVEYSAETHFAKKIRTDSTGWKTQYSEPGINCLAQKFPLLYNDQKLLKVLLDILKIRRKREAKTF